MVYDATYFHKDGCLLNLMDATNQKIITHIYVKKESFSEAHPWFIGLKKKGLNPQFIVTDGERSTIRAMRLVWPEAKLQRCLYHLQHEGMRWLRSYPKTEGGKALRDILSRLSWIKNEDERDAFLREYREWIQQYKDHILSMPRISVARKDLKRTMVLINNALPEMFRYLDDSNVHSTTNALEGFHSRLKSDYRRHRGLTKEHRIQYIDWYCFFKNSNTN
jgi:transposase-like protein